MSGERFLVVIDPMVDTQPALDRALQSIGLTNGSLHLFKAAFYANSDEKDNATEELKHQILQQTGKQLLNLAAQAIDAGIEVSTELVWTKDWGAAVIDSVKRNQIFMVFKSSYIHNQIERREDTLELALLRNSPCPVLLMHDNSRWENRKVLAAVNLATTDRDHQLLNQKVINIAMTFKAAYDSEVHIVNAKPRETVSHVTDDDDTIFSATGWQPQQEAVEKIQLNEDYISQQCGGLDKEFIHIEQGQPIDIILNCAEKINADLIVLGTVARSGIKSWIIGNMAEKIMDKTRCDILTLSQAGEEKPKPIVPFS